MGAVEGHCVLTAGAGVTEADEIVSEASVAIAVGIECMAEQVAVFEIEKRCLQQVIQYLCNRVVLEPVTRPQNPDGFTEYDVIDEQALTRFGCSLNERIDTSALQRIIVNEVPQENVRVYADQRFLA